MQKQISFKNSKGQRLAGVLHIPQGRGPFPAVIVQHGFIGSHNNFLIKSIASALGKSGFIALRFSLSGHKPSGGTYKEVVVGQHLKDIAKAIDFLRKIPQVNKARIGIFGYSLGALLALFSASAYTKLVSSIVALSSPYNFKKVISSYSREKAISERGKDYWVIRGFKTSKRFFGDSWCKKKAELIKEVHCPSLIIHGDKDTRVLFQDARLIFNLIDGPKELKIIKGAGHSFKNQNQAKQIVALTTSWFKKYLAFREDSVVNAFLKYKNQILFFKRSQKVSTHRGLWAPVGGYLDGQPVIKKARQEVIEETGIKPSMLKNYQRGKVCKFAEPKIDRVWLINPVLFELKRKPKIKLDWEHTDYKWVRIDDLKKIRPLEPALKHVFKNLSLTK